MQTKFVNIRTGHLENRTMIYLKWRKDGKVWQGVTSNGDIAYMVERKRWSRRTQSGVYLTRKNGAVEVCHSIRDAKDYAQSLARLHNYAPY